MDTLSNSPEIVAAAFGMTMNSLQLDSLTIFIFERLENLSPEELKVCVPLVFDRRGYKRMLQGLPQEGETVLPTWYQEKLFELIAAMGKHAVAFKADFEKFEQFEWKDSGEYDKARKAVFGVTE